MSGFLLLLLLLLALPGLASITFGLWCLVWERPRSRGRADRVVAVTAPVVAHERRRRPGVDHGAGTSSGTSGERG